MGTVTPLWDKPEQPTPISSDQDEIGHHGHANPGDSGFIANVQCFLGWHRWEFQESHLGDMMDEFHIPTKARCRNTRCREHRWSRLWP